MVAPILPRSAAVSLVEGPPDATPTKYLTIRLSDGAAFYVAGAAAGGATEATLLLIKAKTDNLDVLLSTRAVTGLTDAQLRAAAVPVSGAFFQATQPVSIAAVVTVDTELPAAAALTDVTGNPTAPMVGAALMGFNGATWERVVTSGDNVDATAVSGSSHLAAVAHTLLFNGASWDRARGTIANGLLVDVSRSALPTGAATEATLALIKAKTDNLDVALSTRAVTGLTDAQLRATAVPTKETRSAAAAQTSVAGSAVNVTLLAANAARLGASVYNDSTAILFVRFQATASAANFSVKLFPEDYCEVPFGYTGIIDGIWASATGNARVTEYT